MLLFTSCPMMPGEEIPDDITVGYEDDEDNITFKIIYAAKCNNLIALAHVLPWYSDYIDFQDVRNNNNTALHYAVHNRNINMVKLLLDYDADPNISNNDGDTPLFDAMRLNLIDIAELLMDAGASLDHYNHEGKTPRDYVESAKMQILLDYFTYGN